MVTFGHAEMSIFRMESHIFRREGPVLVDQPLGRPQSEGFRLRPRGRVSSGGSSASLPSGSTSDQRSRGRPDELHCRLQGESGHTRHSLLVVNGRPSAVLVAACLPILRLPSQFLRFSQDPRCTSAGGGSVQGAAYTVWGSRACPLCIASK